MIILSELGHGNIDEINYKVYVKIWGQQIIFQILSPSKIPL